MADFIGPINQEKKSGKRSLDDIVASIVGKREDRPDNIDEGIRGLARNPIGRELASARVRDKGEAVLHGLLYVAKNADKETSINVFDAFNNKFALNIFNQATGIETDVAEKFNWFLPTRIDENTIFDIALQTFDTLPNDLKATVMASTNLAKDTDITAILEDNDFGLQWNNNTQKIEGHFDVNIDSETLKPTIIRPKYTKDNKNDEITKQILLAHGDLPPDREKFLNPEHYQMAMKIWKENKNKEYFALDLVSEPTSDFTGAKTTFATKNISGWGTIEQRPDEDLSYIEATGTIPNYLLKDQEPIELTGSFLKQNEGQESQLRADVPLPFGFTPYIKKTTGDRKDELDYGINLDKTGKLGILDYRLTGDINKDKDYRLSGKIGTDNVGLGGWYDAEGNWHAGITGKWTWGDTPKRNQTYQTTDIKEAYDFSKDKLLAGGGIAGMLGKPTYAKGGRVRMASGGIVGILKL